MLTPDQFDRYPASLIAIFHDFEDSVITDIARRLAGLPMTASAVWQTQRLLEAGSLYDDILSKLSALTGRSETELRRIFKRAGVESVRFDDKIYRAAGLEPLPINASPQMAQVLALGIQRTAGVMRNLTATTALAGQQSFIQAADLAYIQVSSGAFSYDQAIRAAINSVGESGLGILYPNGRMDKLDVAMRRTVLTGIGQTAGQLQEARADDMDQDLVEVSAHGGARPSHQIWQGKVYSRSGQDPRYPNFVQETGYGTGPGLGGWNCRHSFYPFFDGVSKEIYDDATRAELSEQTVTYGGKEYSAYEASQIQRGVERKIREWKRRSGALQAAKLDATREVAKVSEWQSRMRDFIRQTSLQRQSVRELV